MSKDYITNIDFKGLNVKIIRPLPSELIHFQNKATREYEAGVANIFGKILEFGDTYWFVIDESGCACYLYKKVWEIVEDENGTV